MIGELIKSVFEGFTTGTNALTEDDKQAAEDAIKILLDLAETKIAVFLAKVALKEEHQVPIDKVLSSKHDVRCVFKRLGSEKNEEQHRRFPASTTQKRVAEGPSSILGSSAPDRQD